MKCNTCAVEERLFRVFSAYKFPLRKTTEQVKNERSKKTDKTAAKR